MEHSRSHHLVPEQHTGTHKDFRSAMTMDTTEDAEDLFLLAKERLLDINNWHTLSKGLHVTFQLTDVNGNELHRSAHTGDYIKIDIPAPENKTGEGYDWVHIEGIRYDDYPDDNGEAISMIVRPAAAPVSKDGHTAHFFSEKSTSTFNIERHGRMVVAHYYGRNELPNTDAESLLDKARNIVVAIGGLLGMSDMQWKSMTEGLVALPE